MKLKNFAEYLSTIMNLGDPPTLTARKFEADETRHTAYVLEEIMAMDNNKAVGTDGIHVEMLKSNSGKTAELLTNIWQTVGHTPIVPKH